MRTTLYPFIAILLALLLAPGAHGKDAQPKVVPGKEYRLEIQGIPSSEKQRWDKAYKIDEKGRIDLPIGGKLKVGGLPLNEAARIIERHLKSRGIFISPAVTLGPRKKG
ncbi:MAG: polysaccharide biosynthesis/export family protein [Akkermansiaceae bacterium]|nr:polysaccharide biosynthesis/export family protein [Akkermansiaceae bacterium]